MGKVFSALKCKEGDVAEYLPSFYPETSLASVIFASFADNFFLQDISHVLKVRINAKIINRVSESPVTPLTELDEKDSIWPSLHRFVDYQETVFKDRI